MAPRAETLSRKPCPSRRKTARVSSQGARAVSRARLSGQGQSQAEGTGNQGGQELFTLRGQEYENSGGRGFFQGFEQGVGRLVAVQAQAHEQDHPAALTVGRVAQTAFQLTYPLHVEGPHQTGIFLILAVADAAVIGRQIQIFARGDLQADRAGQTGRAVFGVRGLRAVAARGPVAGQIQALLLAAAFQQQNLGRGLAQTVQHGLEAVKGRSATAGSRLAFMAAARRAFSARWSGGGPRPRKSWRPSRR